MSQQDKENKKHSKRKWLFYPALALGVLVLVVLVKNKAEPQREPPQEQARATRVIAAPMVEVLPSFSGNGNVEPGQVGNGWDGTIASSHEVCTKFARILPKPVIIAARKSLELLFTVRP